MVVKVFFCHVSLISAAFREGIYDIKFTRRIVYGVKTF